MKKILASLMFFLCALLISSSVYALPILSSTGNNEIFYNNYENVFRYNATNDRYEQLVYPTDPTQTTGIPTLQLNDIFLGIVQVQNINSTGSTVWSSQPGIDEVTGVFAQQITAINPITATTEGFAVQIDLGVSATNEFWTAGGVINTGLDLNAGETMKFYTDDGLSTFDYGGNLSMYDSFQTANDGTEWLSIGLVDSDDYTYTNITPQGQNLGAFDGRTYLGMSILDAAFSGWSEEILNDINEDRFNSIVDFYAQSELQANDGHVAGWSPWVFASNDPAVIGPVPEPTTMLLFGIGLLGAAGLTRRKQD